MKQAIRQKDTQARSLALLLCAAMLTLLAACSGGQASPQDAESQQEITVIADFSGGSERAGELGLIRSETRTVAEVTPEAMAQSLTEWSNLDFTLDGATVSDQSITIDWAATSTLIAGLDGREQKDDFFFYDQDSLRWFMMDSLYSTLTANFGECEVYYTMDGGQALAFDELYPVRTFPVDTPYLGSPFYFAHAGLKGDMDQQDFSRTAGIWTSEDEAAAVHHIEMDGAGNFVTYDAYNAVLAEGFLHFVDEYEDGNGRYDMYDPSGMYLNGFYFDAEDRIHFGNYADVGYVQTDDVAEALPASGVLVYSPGFTGMEMLETNNDFHGGYYESSRMEDGMTIVVNCGFRNDFTASNETIEEYIDRCIELVSAMGFRERSITSGYRWSYPVYRLSWLSGENEDTRHWEAFMVCTDWYTYLFAFDTAADYAGEMAGLYEDVFNQLELVFPSES